MFHLENKQIVDAEEEIMVGAISTILLICFQSANNDEVANNGCTYHAMLYLALLFFYDASSSTFGSGFRRRRVHNRCDHSKISSLQDPLYGEIVIEASNWHIVQITLFSWYRTHRKQRTHWLIDDKVAERSNSSLHHSSCTVSHPPSPPLRT
jgi:hypothetical protein